MKLEKEYIFVNNCDYKISFIFLKETVKEKWKGVIGWNLRISGVEWYIKDFYPMFLSQEIDIKLCQIYTKIHIYAILYKSCSIK